MRYVAPLLQINRFVTLKYKIIYFFLVTYKRKAKNLLDPLQKVRGPYTDNHYSKK